jgi:surface carbohydrate biosynthesis protein
VTRSFSPRAWLLIPIETKVRELEGKVLLAACAVEAGYGVVLGRKAAMDTHAAQLPRGVLLSKSVQAGVLDGIRRFKALGYSYVSLDEEGVVHLSDQAFLRERFSAETVVESDLIMTWGDHQAEVLREAFPTHRERIIVTGNPRVDLWRPELREYHAQQVEALRRKWGRFVLLVSNFSTCNHARGPDGTLHYLRADGAIQTPEDEAYYRGYIAHFRRIFDAFVDALPKLAERLTCDIVVRPHPSEDAAAWRTVAENIPGVSVVFEGPITPWLLAAEAVIHNGCTSGLEAFVLERPVVAYRPVVSPAHDLELPNSVSHQVYTESDLLDWAVAVGSNGNGVHRSSNELKGARELAAQYIAALDGTLAADRIVAALDGIAGPRERYLLTATPVWRRAWLSLRAVIKRMLTRSRIQPAWLLGHDRADRWKHADYGLQKMPGISMEDISDVLGRLMGSLDRFDEVEITTVAGSLFLMTRTEVDDN